MKSHQLITHWSNFTAIIVLTLIAGMKPSNVQAEENYLGAAAVLQKISGQTNAPDKSKSPRAKQEAQLRADIKAFGKQAATLPAEETAKEWLGLFDRFSKLGPAAVTAFNNEEDSLQFNSLMEVLPPPATWEALQKAVESRPAGKGMSKEVREIVLRLFAHTLTGNQAAQKADMALLEALLAKADPNENYSLAGTYEQLNEIILRMSADPSVIMTSLERQLAQAKNKGESQQLQLPNLISLVGTNKAEEFLRRALRTSYVPIQIRQGSEMKTLARKLALEMVAELKVPHWQLAESLEGMELYEALDKRFMKPDADDAAVTNAPVLPNRRGYNRDEWNRSTAEWYYFLALITHHRAKEAVELSKKIDKTGGMGYQEPEALTSLERAGYGLELNNFFHELLSQNPRLPFWQQYVQVAANAGKAEEMLALAQTAAAREDLSERERKEIRGYIYRALLAADKVEEGVKEIQKMLAAEKEDPDEAATASGYTYGVQNGLGKAEMGLMLARIGVLVGHKDWIEQGISASRKALMDGRGKPGDYQVTGTTVELARLLAETGRGPEAEAFLADAIADAGKVPSDDQNGMGYNNENTSRTYLIALAQLYHGANRSADVLTLLDAAPQWEAKDLAEIYQESGMMDFHPHHVSGDGSVGYIAAWALAASGRKDEARKIVDVLLEHDGGLDPAYELLMQLGDTNMAAHLDKLFANDQFEERPLIWKAHWLRQAGKLEEAEAAARHAISIDPSDGEQGPGNRMRAYAELADIREARGDQKQAEFFRGAVTAIRMSEKADRYYEAGLLSQAVKMYEESLNHFADAYCIQSRLALRLSELGLHEQAEVHYRRAYELMPESFGRVESHCFGCEGVFNGERAQNLAEKVFGELAVKTPDKPQVHYLLGYLREEQGRFQNALPEQQLAVKLDPDYLNAWKHLQTIGTELHLPAADRDAVSLNLLRLDPLGRHDRPDFKDVSDLRALWQAVAATQRLEPATPTALYTLAASKAGMEAKPKIPKSAREMMMMRYANMRETPQKLTPQSAISDQLLMAVIINLLGGNAMGAFD